MLPLLRGVGLIGVEHLDAAAVGDIDVARARLDRQRMRQRLAAGALQPAQHGAAVGVHLQEFIASHHPQLAQTVDGHVQHRGIQGEERCRTVAAILGVVVDGVAFRARADEQ